MKESEILNSKLLNYKFASALQYTHSESEETKELVKSLSGILGDVGWFDGDMAVIVRHALRSIGVKFYD